ncbi:MAG: hypothetical protein O3A19_12920, partial [Planctomycetota bacterium]|nr:hypothetical protein [Planctomycetota bacterium]
MTMPLVQLGPGGDYIRRIVPSNDRLLSVTRPFSLTDPQGRLVSRPTGAHSSAGPIAWLLTALQAIGLIQIRTAAASPHADLVASVPPQRPLRRRRIGISNRTARKFQELTRDQIVAVPSKDPEILERC